MPQLWEWVPSVSVSVSPEFKGVLPDSAAYGAEYEYDVKRPQRMVTLKGSGLTEAECLAFEALCITRGGSTTITDKLGTAHTGRLISFAYENDPINGTELYDATAQLRTPIT